MTESEQQQQQQLMSHRMKRSASLSSIQAWACAPGAPGGDGITTEKSPGPRLAASQEGNDTAALAAAGAESVSAPAGPAGASLCDGCPPLPPLVQAIANRARVFRAKAAARLHMSLTRPARASTAAVGAAAFLVALVVVALTAGRAPEATAPAPAAPSVPVPPPVVEQPVPPRAHSLVGGLFSRSDAYSCASIYTPDALLALDAAAAALRTLEHVHIANSTHWFDMSRALWRPHHGYVPPCVKICRPGYVCSGSRSDGSRFVCYVSGLLPLGPASSVRSRQPRGGAPSERTLEDVMPFVHVVNLLAQMIYAADDGTALRIVALSLTDGASVSTISIDTVARPA